MVTNGGCLMLVNWDELLFLALSEKMGDFEQVGENEYSVPDDFVRGTAVLLEVWREFTPEQSSDILTIMPAPCRPGGVKPSA